MQFSVTETIAAPRDDVVRALADPGYYASLATASSSVRPPELLSADAGADPPGAPVVDQPRTSHGTGGRRPVSARASAVGSARSARSRRNGLTRARAVAGASMPSPQACWRSKV